MRKITNLVGILILVAATVYGAAYSSIVLEIDNESEKTFVTLSVLPTIAPKPSRWSGKSLCVTYTAAELAPGRDPSITYWQWVLLRTASVNLSLTAADRSFAVVPHT